MKGAREMRKSIPISWDSINEGHERAGTLKKKKKIERKLVCWSIERDEEK